MRKFLQSLFIRLTRQRPLFQTKSPRHFAPGQIVGYENGPYYSVTHVIEIERGVWQIWGRPLRPDEITAHVTPFIIDRS